MILHFFKSFRILIKIPFCTFSNLLPSDSSSCQDQGQGQSEQQLHSQKHKSIYFHHRKYTIKQNVRTEMAITVGTNIFWDFIRQFRIGALLCFLFVNHFNNLRKQGFITYFFSSHQKTSISIDGSRRYFVAWFFFSTGIASPVIIASSTLEFPR